MQFDLMQKVAEVAPSHYEFLTKTAHEIRNSPWRDEIVGEMNTIIKAAEKSAEKLAFSFGGVAQGMGQAAKKMMDHPLPMFIASSVAAGVATNLAGDLYEAARRGLTKSRHWSNMLKANPDLAEQAQSDPAVKTMFDTLHRFNPEFAGDPHVAASWVKTQISFPDDIGIQERMVQSRKAVRDGSSFRAPGNFNMQLRTPTDLDQQQLQMEGQQAQNFKTRQEGQKLYNERMGMRPEPHKRDRDR
jgi:hypothetical protein